MSDVMFWTILVTAIVAPVGLLAAALIGVLGRLRQLERSQRRLHLRAEQAEALQAKVAGVRARAEAMRDNLAEISARVEQIKQTRADAF